MRGSRGLLVKFVYEFIINNQIYIGIGINSKALVVSWSNIVTPLPHNERLSWSPGEICLQIYNKKIIFHMNWYISRSSRCLMVSWSNIVTLLPHNERISWSHGEICVWIYNKNQFSQGIGTDPKVLAVSWSNLGLTVKSRAPPTPQWEALVVSWWNLYMNL